MPGRSRTPGLAMVWGASVMAFAARGFAQSATSASSASSASGASNAMSASGAMSATLAWVRGRGAERCPDAAAMRAAVEARVGHRVFDEGAGVSIEATVAAVDANGANGAGGGATGVTAPRWRAQIFVRDRSGALIGEREITSTEVECAPVGDAVALAIAVTLDAEAALRAPVQPTQGSTAVPAAGSATVPAASSTAVPASSAVSAPVVSVAPSTSARPRTARRALPVEGAFGARGAISIGPQPGVTLGAGLLFELAPRRWPRFTAVLWYFPESIASTEGGGSLGIRLVGASFAVCPQVARAGRWLVANVCGGIFAGVLTASGRGFSGWNESVNRPFASLEVGGRLRALLGLAYVELAAEATAPVVHDNFVVQGVGSVYRVPLFGFRGSLGAGVHFE